MNDLYGAGYYPGPDPYRDERAYYHTRSTPATDKIIVGYFGSWEDISKINGNKLTHFLYAFADVKNNEMPLTPFPGNLERFKSFKEKYKHLKILVSAGGGSADPREFSNAALTEASRIQFANSAIAFIRQYGFDGIDVDWEFPVTGGNHVGRPEDKQNFTQLLKTLRESLDAAGKQDGKKYLLTIAAGAGDANLQHTEMNKIQNYVDWINIMAYDYHGSSWESTSNHNAPLYADPENPSSQKLDLNVAATVQSYLNYKVKPSKLVLGIPFYGRVWEGCCTGLNGEYQYCDKVPKQQEIPYNVLVENRINMNGYTKYWNHSSKVPYLFNPMEGTYISYDDPDSILYKTRLIQDKCLAGAMIWELSQDFNGVLLDAIHKGLSGRVALPEPQVAMQGNPYMVQSWNHVPWRY